MNFYQIRQRLTLIENLTSKQRKGLGCMASDEDIKDVVQNHIEYIVQELTTVKIVIPKAQTIADLLKLALNESDAELANMQTVGIN